MKHSASDYSYRISPGEGEGEFMATVVEFPGISVFGADPARLMQEIMEVVEESLDMLQDRAPEPASKRVYSGKVMLRMRPEVHRELALRSQESNSSINGLVNDMVERGLATMNHR